MKSINDDGHCDSASHTTQGKSGKGIIAVALVSLRSPLRHGPTRAVLIGFFSVLAATATATEVVKVSAGIAHSLYLSGDSELWVAGDNTYGQLGDGTEMNRISPVQIASEVIAIAGGFFHSLFVKTDGSLWATGNNQNGQLGDGTTINRRSPVLVASQVAVVAAGYTQSFFLKTDGTLWAVGDNSFGQLGDGSLTSRSSPVQVATGVKAVAAGGFHTLYVKTDGTLWSMGANAFGQLGDGSLTNRSSPVQVATGASAVTAGTYHSLFVKIDGTLWAMGYNFIGQLGDGSLTNRTSPVQVATSVSAVDGGSAHSLYVKFDGTLWATGDNRAGQLGDGSLSSRSSPVQVATGVAGVTAGGSHSQYVKTDGTFWSMGANATGQLGDGTTTLRSAPAKIAPKIWPLRQRVTTGQRADFSLEELAETTLPIQWRKDGVSIAGSTSARLTFLEASTADAGVYDAIVTTSGGLVTSSSASLTVVPSRVKNISVRIVVPDNGILTAGFVLDAPKTVLVRGIGRSLEQFGVPAGSTMPNPQINIFNSAGVIVAQDDDYTATPNYNLTVSRAGAFSFSSPQDAALIVPLAAGAYTVQLKPVGGRGGDALVEVYDVDSDVIVATSGRLDSNSPAAIEPGRVKNISVRMAVPDNGVLIAGFVLDAPKTLLVRGIGRSLEQFGVPAGTTMPNPQIDIYNSAGVIVAQNDDYAASSNYNSTAARAAAFSISSPLDAALVMQLAAGAYTVQLKPTGGKGGDALVEVYDVD